MFTARLWSRLFRVVVFAALIISIRPNTTYASELSETPITPANFFQLEEVRRYTPLQSGSDSVSFNRDATRLAYFDLNELVVVDVVANDVLFSATLDESNFRTGFALNGAGTLIAVEDTLGEVEVWDVSSGELIRTLEVTTVVPKFRDDAVPAIYYALDDTLLITASAGLIRFWDAESGEPIGEIADKGIQQGYSECSIAVSPDGMTLAYPTFGGDIILYDLEAREQIQVLSEYSDTAECLAFSGDGTQLASTNTGLEQRLLMWDLQSGTNTFVTGMFIGETGTLTVNHDGSLVLLMMGAGLMQLWAVETGEVLELNTLLPSTLGGAAFSLDGTLLTVFQNVGDIGVIFAATSDS